MLGVIQGCYRPRLLLKPPQALRIARERFSQDLHRHVPAQALVTGTIDFAHSTCA
jgi:hypothetical protein